MARPLTDDQLTAWVDGCLRAAGRRRTGELTPFRTRAWADVYSAPTDQGTVWLKVAAPENAFEAGLYEVLADVVPDHVLVPLGTDPARGWILLPDGGTSAGDRADGDADAITAALVAALPAYAGVQRDLAPHVDRLLAAGVVDMRPAALPAQLDAALAAVARYVEHRGAPQDRADFAQIGTRRDEFASWCAELEGYGRPASLDHNDLHAWNVLDGLRFYDWGDSVVAHPFGCLLTPLHGLSDEHAERLLDAYLAAWGDPRELRAEADLALLVANVARALVWHRAVAADPLDHEHADAPLYYLRRLLTPRP